jgi:triacylglycerol lipase
VLSQIRPSVRQTPALAPSSPAPAHAAHFGLGDWFEEAKSGLETLVHSVEQAFSPSKLPAALADFSLFGWPGRGSAGKAGWAAREGAPTTDSTSRFRSVYGAAKSGRNTLPADAKNYVYLSVDGLYGNSIPGYMKPNDDRLAALGLDVRALKLDTGASVENNAKTIRDAILAASAGGKQVVLVGHSKGGVDTTAALALYPELQPHVRAVVAMQSPYGGTPIASDIVECPELHSLVDGIAGTLMGAKPESLADLSYDARQAFVRAHPYPTGIPTVSLATSRRDLASPLFAGEEYQWARYRLPSDGLVPQADAVIPGSQVVKLNDMDHGDAALDLPFDHYDVGAMTEALVTLALEGKQAN